MEARREGTVGAGRRMCWGKVGGLSTRVASAVGFGVLELQQGGAREPMVQRIVLDRMQPWGVRQCLGN